MPDQTIFSKRAKDAQNFLPRDPHEADRNFQKIRVIAGLVPATHEHGRVS
jgi:hypothetical protein